MNIFNYSNYRDYLVYNLKARPKQGYGELSKWASSCQVHPTLMSLVLKGERDLSPEQGFALGKHLELTTLEHEYFVQLIQLSRAGTKEFKDHISKKLNSIKTEATQIKKRFQHEAELSDDAKLIFYSSYIFSAIRLYCDTRKDGVTLEELMNRFSLRRSELAPKLEFLEKWGLIKQSHSHYQMGPSRTMVSRESTHVIKHHQNWRMQAMVKAERLGEAELMFTCPMAVSEKDFENFRTELTQLIQRFSAMIKDSKSENIGCFNLDWFWL